MKKELPSFNLMCRYCDYRKIDYIGNQFWASPQTECKNTYRIPGYKGLRANYNFRTDTYKDLLHHANLSSLEQEASRDCNFNVYKLEMVWPLTT